MADSGRPLLTVAMPVFNAGEDLRFAVLSIFHQTFTDWELLIIDDGSTDDAVGSIRDLCDSRVRISRDGENRGLGARLNEAVDHARGVYFARMDQDDVSYPERFERQLALLRANPKIDLLATRAILIDEDNTAIGDFPGPVSHPEICMRPWSGFHFPHPTWMGKTDWFRKYRYANPAPYFCEDQELLLRSYRDSNFETANAVLFAYRVRSRMNPAKQARTRLALLRVQLRRFSSVGLWHFAALAMVIFAMKRISDILHLAGVNPFQPTRRRPDSPTRLKWEEVLKTIAKKPEVS